ARALYVVLPALLHTVTRSIPSLSPHPSLIAPPTTPLSTLSLHDALPISSTTRPILRYQEIAKTQAPTGEPLKRFSPVTRRLIGMMPGSDRREALGGDPGVGSVLAYMRQLSEDSDVLVAGSMSAMGLLESSLGTSFRKHMAKGDPQELSLVVHHLSLFDASPLTGGAGRDGPVHAPCSPNNYC